MSRQLRTYVIAASACALLLGGCTAILGLERKSLSDAGSPDAAAAADAEDPAKRLRVFYLATNNGGMIDKEAANVADKADSFCQDTAKAAGLETSDRRWVAWISLPAPPPSKAVLPMKNRLKNVSASRYLVDRTTLVFNGSPFAGTPVHPIDMNAQGQSRSAEDGGGPLHVFTGTTLTGDLAGFHCEGWTSKDAGSFGSVGSTASTGTDWTAVEQALPCNTLGGFYCFEDEGPPPTPAATVTGKSQSPPPLRVY